MGAPLPPQANRSGTRSHPVEPGPPKIPGSSSRALIILSACMALQMISYVMILPLFARRFSEFQADVGALATSAMAYALAATVSAPFMGALADRLGRRALILGSLAVYVAAFTGYRFAASAAALILMRLIAGLFTAGLIPAATGMVADLAPADRRARWIGILNGSSSAGWIIGPIVGGLLYDNWGYNLAINVSIATAGVTLLLALLALPETHQQREAQAATGPRGPGPASASPASGLRAFRSTLPNQLSTFVMLLSVAFGTMFAWSFMEPQFMYYAYGELGWSSSMLGVVMSTFGIAFMLGEFLLSGLGDRWGRKPVIVAGLILFAVQFLGLTFLRQFTWIAAAFAISGLGNALFDPALNASIIDICAPEHRARILGLKSTASSIGSVLGPALVVLFAPALQARGIFLAAAAIVFASLAIFATARSSRPEQINQKVRLQT